MMDMNNNEPEKFKNIYRIPSARLKNWDYSSDGWYFVTICVRNHECAFGNIENGGMILNDIGKMVEQFWKEIPQHFKNVELDAFIVMPNHVHGIVVIDKFGIENNTYKNSPRRDVACYVSTNKNIYSRISPKIGTLSTIIRSFKSACTNNIRKISSDFQWQSRFHDHIIGNDKELKNIRNYIHFNAEKWQDDKENPQNLL
jgi:putative transposase